MKKNIIITILSILVLGLTAFIIYDKAINKDTKKDIEKDTEINDDLNLKHISLINENEEVKIDDKLTIKFIGTPVSGSISTSDVIYKYIAEIYYDGKLIDDNIFSDPDNRIIEHAAAQVGGMYVEKINNIYFLYVYITPTKRAVLILNDGRIINTFYIMNNN